MAEDASRRGPVRRRGGPQVRAVPGRFPPGSAGAAGTARAGGGFPPGFPPVAGGVGWAVGGQQRPGPPQPHGTLMAPP